MPIGLPLFVAIQRKLRNPTGARLEAPDSLVDWENLSMIQPQLKRQLLGECGVIEEAFLLITENFVDLIPVIVVDIHFLWGSNDEIAPLRTGRLLAQLMPDANHCGSGSHFDI